MRLQLPFSQSQNPAGFQPGSSVGGIYDVYDVAGRSGDFNNTYQTILVCLVLFFFFFAPKTTHSSVPSSG